MLKTMGYVTDFTILIDETQMNADECEETDEAVRTNVLGKQLKESDNYKNIFSRWEASSRMRTWYSEK